LFSQLRSGIWRIRSYKRLAACQRRLGFLLLLSGYQRELTYRHRDGSYSAWGEADEEGSLWLTLFVVRSFARAQAFIYVDPADLATSVNWIRDQQLENGCFRPVGVCAVFA